MAEEHKQNETTEELKQIDTDNKEGTDASSMSSLSPMSTWSSTAVMGDGEASDTEEDSESDDERRQLIALERLMRRQNTVQEANERGDVVQQLNCEKTEAIKEEGKEEGDIPTEGNAEERVMATMMTERDEAAHEQRRYHYYGSYVVLNDRNDVREDLRDTQVCLCEPFDGLRVILGVVYVHATEEPLHTASTRMTMDSYRRGRERRLAYIGGARRPRCRYALIVSKEPRELRSIRLALRAKFKTQLRYRSTSPYFEVGVCDPLTSPIDGCARLYGIHSTETEAALKKVLEDAVRSW